MTAKTKRKGWIKKKINRKLSFDDSDDSSLMNIMAKWLQNKKIKSKYSPEQLRAFGRLKIKRK